MHPHKRREPAPDDNNTWLSHRSISYYLVFLKKLDNHDYYFEIVDSVFDVHIRSSNIKYLSMWMDIWWVVLGYYKSFDLMLARKKRAAAARERKRRQLIRLDFHFR